jgi:hypothetical protein
LVTARAPIGYLAFRKLRWLCRVEYLPPAGLQRDQIMSTRNYRVPKAKAQEFWIANCQMPAHLRCWWRWWKARKFLRLFQLRLIGPQNSQAKANEPPLRYMHMKRNPSCVSRPSEKCKGIHSCSIKFPKIRCSSTLTSALRRILLQRLKTELVASTSSIGDNTVGRHWTDVEMT